MPSGPQQSSTFDGDFIIDTPSLIESNTSDSDSSLTVKKVKKKKKKEKKEKKKRNLKQYDIGTHALGGGECKIATGKSGSVNGSLNRS